MIKAALYVSDFLSIFRAIKLGTLLECPTSDPAELETCLQKVNASQIVVAQFGVASNAAYPFVPVVDGVFLPDKPEVSVDSHSLYGYIQKYCHASLYLFVSCSS